MTRLKSAIVREYRWEMGHALMNHKGKCYNPHGHNYRMLVELSGVVGEPSGMVMDFGEVDEIVKPIIKKDYDHKFFINQEDVRFQIVHDYLNAGFKLLEGEPTAENLAIKLFQDIEGSLDKRSNVALEGIVLYETDNAAAIVRHT